MAAEPEFKEYQKQVVANAQALCKRMQSLGYTVVSGGTDTHLILVDLNPQLIDGSRVQQVLDEVCYRHDGSEAFFKIKSNSFLDTLIPYIHFMIMKIHNLMFEL